MKTSPRTLVPGHLVGILFLSVLFLAGCGAGEKEPLDVAQKRDPALARRASYPQAFAEEDERRARAIEEMIANTERQIEELIRLEAQYRAKAKDVMKDKTLTEAERKARASFQNGMAERTRGEIERLRELLKGLQSRATEHRLMGSENRRRAQVFQEGGIPKGQR